jgi:hypothetical protein
MLTYVYDMAIHIQHDISIVAILYLKQESNNTICSHRFYKVSAGILKYWH